MYVFAPAFIPARAEMCCVSVSVDPTNCPRACFAVGFAKRLDSAAPTELSTDWAKEVVTWIGHPELNCK